MTSKTAAPPAKPLKIPAPRDVAEGRIARRLTGHSTSRAWLPDWPEISDQRAEHEQLRAAAGDALDRLDELAAGFAREDDEHIERMKRAARSGEAMPKDERVPPAERDDLLEAVADEVWARLAALADLIDEVRVQLVTREDEILTRMRQARAVAEDARREAERAVAEARKLEWSLDQGARWLMHTTDGGPSASQPFPQPSAPPAIFRGQAELERAWHRPKPAPPAPAEDEGEEISEMVTTEPAA